MQTITIPLKTDPAQTVERAKATARQLGATFNGDAQEGQFSGMGIRGRYAIADGHVVVTIIEKPDMIPETVVESTVTSFFASAPEAAEPPPTEDAAALRKKGDDIITSHVLWSLGAGLIPVPMFDMAAVTAVQVGLIEQLAQLYDMRVNQSSGKPFVTALTGTTAARIGASLLKAIPGLGTVVGGASMSVLSGASTYAVGQVALNHFERRLPIGDIDLSAARAAYSEKFEEGKKVVENMESDQNEDTTKDVFQKLEKLARLRDQGVLSEEEFAAQKARLLERL